MDYSNLIKHFKNPHKLFAFSLFFLFLGLFLKELLSYYLINQIESENLTAPVHQQTEKITSNSPLFSVPLFGEHVQQVQTEQVVKPSVLDAEVVGILYSEVPSQNKVILHWHNGTEEGYGLEDVLPGGGIVKKIEQDKIIVLHHGMLESLSYPKTLLLFEEVPKPVKE